MEYIYTSELPRLNFNCDTYIDTETEGLYGKIRLLQIYQPQNKDLVYIVDVKGYPVEVIKEYVKQFSGKLWGYNLLYDLECLGFIFDDCPQYNDLYLSSKLTFYEREASQSKPSWDLYSVLEYVGVKVPIDKKAMQKSDFSSFHLTEQQILYSAYDVYYLPILRKEIEKRIPNIWTHNRVYRLDLFVSKTLLDIHKSGLQVNEEIKFKVMEDLTKRGMELEALFKGKFNPLSPKQITKYYNIPSSDEKTLKKLIGKLPYIKEILEYRSIVKDLSFLTKYSGRVYGKFNVVGTKSGRMSCSNENIQQIPRHLRNVFGFTEDDDRVYVIADFPQIELRLAGIIWNETNMIKAFKEGIDLHKYTASVIFNKSIDEVSKEERQISKSANFGLLYGMGAERFREYVFTTSGIKLSEEEAKTIRYNWMRLFNVVANKHRQVGNILNNDNYYQDITWLGRKYITNQYSEALNLQIQGSGAELLKTVVKNIYLRNTYNRSQFKIVNLIHDEIVIETTKDYAKDVADMLKHEMEIAWEECIEHSKLPILSKFNLEVEYPTISKNLEK